MTEYKHEFTIEVTRKEKKAIVELLDSMRKPPTPDMDKWANFGKNKLYLEKK